ncbi:MAG: hypothetical protein OXM61_16725 [Candidatus Poribacteria bacterium]|nr:hypothetical protein [Candidatus Poribacteria bacterium]
MSIKNITTWGQNEQAVFAAIPITQLGTAQKAIDDVTTFLNAIEMIVDENPKLKKLLDAQLGKKNAAGQATGYAEYVQAFLTIHKWKPKETEKYPNGFPFK